MVRSASRLRLPRSLTLLIALSLFLVVAMLGGCVPRTGAPAMRSAGLVQAPPGAFPAAMLPPMSQNFSGSMMFLNREMILPEGRWKVAAIQAIGSKTAGLVVGIVALVRTDGPTLRGVLILSGNAKPLPNGFPVSVICQSSDVIWNDIRQAAPQGEQDCAAINFERPALWRAAQKTVFPGIMGALDLLNVQTPNYLVGVVVHEANLNWALDEMYLANPDAEGIAPDLSTQRALSGWAAFHLAADPQRQHFVDELKARVAPLRLALRRHIEEHAPYIPHSGLTPA